MVLSAGTIVDAGNPTALLENPNGAFTSLARHQKLVAYS
jgi:ABC-type multidrug transport system fused ATPase/permease subunit